MIYRFVTTMTRMQKSALFSALDGITLIVALVASVLLVLGGAADVMALAPLCIVLVTLGVVGSHWLGLPRVTLNAFELPAALRCAVLATGLAAVGWLIAPELSPDLHGGVFAVFAALMTLMVVAGRVALRALTVQVYRQGRPRRRVLIYGAGRTGQQLVAALRHDEVICPVGFVDDNPTLQSTSLAGLPVLAPAAIPQMVARGGVDRVVLAMPSLSKPAMARMVARLRGLGCEVQVLPSFAELLGEAAVARPDSPRIDELLGRTGLENDLPAVRDTYRDQRVMVTGAGGSIGAELCRQIMACAPAHLVLVDHSELALYNIEKELRDAGARVPVTAILGSVLDVMLMRQVIEENRIGIVLHAAAYKHLPMVECNALSGLKNNVLGTKALADVARECAVERFILVSSDKAVRPTNVMGASKRLAELVVQDLATRSEATRFSMVRFGNVLGSSGSVIPVFEEQIARGGPVTLTHAEVTRYFMTIPEAVRLVLLAGSFARGGDVFVLDMGDPVPIARLARQMIEGAGLSVRDLTNPDGDIEISITGLRAGEKLHEELLIAPDMLTTPHPKILRAQEKALSEFEMATALKDLRDAITLHDEAAARAVIHRWVEQAIHKDEAASGR